MKDERPQLCLFCLSLGPSKTLGLGLIACCVSLRVTGISVGMNLLVTLLINGLSLVP